MGKVQQSEGEIRLDATKDLPPPGAEAISAAVMHSCGSEYLRRARCGKTARRDLCGGLLGNRQSLPRCEVGLEDDACSKSYMN